MQVGQPISDSIVSEMDAQFKKITCATNNRYLKLLHGKIFAEIWFSKSSLSKVIEISCHKFNKIRNQH